MIDHLFLFRDKAACTLAKGAGDCWLENDVTYMPVNVVMSDAVFIDEDSPITERVLAPGYWMIARTNERNAMFEAMPECLLVTDSDLAAADEPFIYKSGFYRKTKLGRVDPLFTEIGGYPLPTGPASNLVPLMVA